MSFERDGIAAGQDAVRPATDAVATAAGGLEGLSGVVLLFIDASAPRVQTGLWQDGRWLAHRCTDAPALEEIFRSVAALLEQAGLPFSAIGGFIHNEGPGSILGIRLGAMAMRVWAQGNAAGRRLPVWAVRSLPLVAAKIALQAQADASAGAYGVFSEFRQGLWNWFMPARGDVFGDGIEVIETDELAVRLAALPQRCWHLRHRKSWEAPPGVVCEADSDLADFPQVFLLPGLLRQVAEPEALLTRAPEFQTTSGERHRGAAMAGSASASGKDIASGKHSASADDTAQAGSANISDDTAAERGEARP